MATQFPVPAGPSIYASTIEYFRGCDLVDASTNVDLSRSPECPNMVRDEVGKVRKRTGFHTLHTFEEGAVNGIYLLRGGACAHQSKWFPEGQRLIHVGKALYLQDYNSWKIQLPGTQIPTPGDGGGGDHVDLFATNMPGDDYDERPEVPPGMDDPGRPAVEDKQEYPEGELVWKKMFDGLADTRSWGVQFGGRFFILDGSNIWVWCDDPSADGGKGIKPITELAKVPHVVISSSPSGLGGVQLNPFNLLSDGFIQSFKGEAGAVDFRLCKQNLTVVEKVEVLSGGIWNEKEEDTDYTVDLEAGTVHFETAPGAPDVAGEDNVRITARWQRDTDEDGPARITRCRFGVLYGVDGAQDRLFLSGNPSHPNMDFYSEFEDPTYFGDTSYCAVGQDEGRITGYSTLGNLLVTHREQGQDERNIFLRSGRLNDEGKAAFATTNVIQGEGTVSRWAFGSLGSEPLFLTKKGVYALTAREITGERYSQQRSHYISPVIQAADDLSQVSAVVWRDFYVMALDGRLYLLDGLQKTYSKDAPSSEFQYECYYWTDIPARVLWAEGNTLFFGTEDGRLCAFCTDPDDLTAYNDDGRAIDAYWDTPDMDGKGFWRNKTFRYVACRLASAASTGVNIFAQVKGLWRKIYTDRGKAIYFDWNRVDLSRFSFSADRTPHTLGGKIKLKKVDKVRFRFRNCELNEPFGLYGIGLEYTEPGSRYKG